MTQPRAVRVLDDDGGIVADVRGGHRRQHAAVGIDAGHEQGVDLVLAQDEVEVGGDEAVVAFLGIDDPVAVAVIERGDRLAAGRALDVVALDILARVAGIVGTGAPERVGADLAGISIGGHEVDDRYRRRPAAIKESLVGGDYFSRQFRFKRHRRDRRVEMAPVAVDGHHRRLDVIDSNIHEVKSPLFP
jgi:hypothetical protein